MATQTQTQTQTQAEAAPEDLELVRYAEVSDEMLDLFVSAGDTTEVRIIQERSLDRLARLALTAA